jgi:hypothetical protein
VPAFATVNILTWLLKSRVRESGREFLDDDLLLGHLDHGLPVEALEDDRRRAEIALGGALDQDARDALGP